jgi:hypothetical protein
MSEFVRIPYLQHSVVTEYWLVLTTEIGLTYQLNRQYSYYQLSYPAVINAQRCVGSSELARHDITLRLWAGFEAAHVFQTVYVSRWAAQSLDAGLTKKAPGDPGWIINCANRCFSGKHPFSIRCLQFFGRQQCMTACILIQSPLLILY